MAVLRTLPGRIKTLNTRRVNILKGEQRRVSGSARVSLKRHIWLRDAGQCCLCGRVVDLCDSELITELHFSSVVVMRRRISGRSVPNAIDKSLLVKRRVVCRTRRCRRCPEVMAGQTISSDCDPPRGGGSSGEKNDRSGHRPPSHAEKKFPFQGS